MKDTSRTARWRAERLDHWKFVEGQVRQGHLAFALRTWLSHQYLSHRLVALCKLGGLPRLDRPSVGAHASSASRFEPGGALAQLVALRLRVVQGAPWSCVLGQHGSANDQA